MRGFVLMAVGATLCWSGSVFAEGALAVGRMTYDDGGFADNYGVAWDHQTVGQARAGAFAECREDEEVADACRVVATFRRQ